MNFLKIFCDSFQDNWMSPAVTSIETGLTMDYGSMASRIARFHNVMDAMGVKRGDRVAISGRNSIDWMTAYMATLTAGFTAVAIPSSYSPEEVISLAGMVESDYLFIDDVEAIGSINVGELAPSLKVIVAIDTSHVIAEYNGAPEELDKKLDNIDREFMLQYPLGFQPQNIHSPVLPGDALMGIFFTSGTTSTPKAVMLSADSMEGNVIYGIKTGIHPGGTRVLTAAPLGNIWGCVFDMLSAFASGARIYAFDNGNNTHELIRALSIARPHKILLSPRQVSNIYQRAEQRVNGSRLIRLLGRIPGVKLYVKYRIRRMFDHFMGGSCAEIVMGGTAPSEKLVWNLRNAGIRFTVPYGLTECGGLIAYTPASDWEPGTAGHTARHVLKCRLRKVDLDLLPDDVGELQVYGMTLMKGYCGDEELTRRVIGNDGWLSTGDLVKLAPDGVITIVGRLDTMIVTSSGVIFPEKLELLLISQPGIRKAVVVEREEGVTAVIEPDDTFFRRRGMTDVDRENWIRRAVGEVNRLSSLHERIGNIEISEEPLQLTSKSTVRRYYYY